MARQHKTTNRTHDSRGVNTLSSEGWRFLWVSLETVTRRSWPWSKAVLVALHVWHAAFRGGVRAPPPGFRNAAYLGCCTTIAVSLSWLTDYVVRGRVDTWMLIGGTPVGLVGRNDPAQPSPGLLFGLSGTGWGLAKSSAMSVGSMKT